MVDLTQVEIEVIVSLAIGIISLIANRICATDVVDNFLNRFFAVIFLLAIGGAAYLAYVQSRDIVFAAIAVIATLLLLFFFVALSLGRK